MCALWVERSEWWNGLQNSCLDPLARPACRLHLLRAAQLRGGTGAAAPGGSGRAAGSRWAGPHGAQGRHVWAGVQGPAASGGLMLCNITLRGGLWIGWVGLGEVGWVVGWVPTGTKLAGSKCAMGFALLAA